MVEVVVEVDLTMEVTTTMAMAGLFTLLSRTPTTRGQYTMEEATIRVGHNTSHSKDLLKGGALLPVHTMAAPKARLVVIIIIKPLLNNRILGWRTATSAKPTATRLTTRRVVTLHPIRTPQFPRFPNATTVRKSKGRATLVCSRFFFLSFNYFPKLITISRQNQR